MNIQRRRMITLLFFLTFLIAAPITIAISLGYRYDWQKNKFVKTGILTLKTNPTDVSIFINNKKVKHKRNDDIYRFTYLLPNTYHIRIEKEGYLPWEKSLPVESEKVTTAFDIALFRSGAIQMIKKGYFKVADDRGGDVLLITGTQDEGDKLVAFQPDKNTFTTVFPGTKDAGSPILEYALWSDTREKILVPIGEDTFIVDPRDPDQRISVSDTFGNPFEHMRWKKFSNSILYGWREKTLFELNLLSRQKREIYSLPKEIGTLSEQSSPMIYKTSPYIVARSKLYYFLSTLTGEVLLQEKDLRSENIPPITMQNFPIETWMAFPASNNEPLFFEDYGKTIYIQLDDKSTFFPLRAETAERKNGDWLYKDGFEIGVWNELNQQRRLINRYSQEIEKILWHPSLRYAIFTKDNGLWVIELDTRDIVNEYEIAQMEIIKDVFINQQGDTVYMTGMQTETDFALYSVKIQ
jgi:hypothetical protein